MKIKNILTSGWMAVFFLCLSVLLEINAVHAASPVTIIVNKGSFAGAEEAAMGEEKVNWWDADLTDDRACTECFAATELAHFLPLCTQFSRGCRKT